MSLKAILAVSTAMSAYGSYQQGKMQKEMNAYNAKIAMQNKIIAAEKAELNKQALRRKLRKVQGSTIVGYAKAGVHVAEGTPIDLFEENAILAKMDELMIDYNADLEARGYQVKADTATFTGEAALRSAKMKAAGSLITGYGTYQYGKEIGIFS